MLSVLKLHFRLPLVRLPFQITQTCLVFLGNTWT